MKIAVIGAGFSGLSATKYLKRLGHGVTLFEKEADVGGVWSKSRHYPGLTTQNVRDTYYLSDFPMPKDFFEYPTAQQVQTYLDDYATHFDLYPVTRLSTEVISAEQDLQDKSWTVTSRNRSTQEEQTERFDYLVVANGIFSTPFIPPYEGREEFEQAGGQLLTPSQCPSLDPIRGKHVLVVGYGKSACDYAVAIADAAASTTVVARHLIWKMPKKVGKAVHYKYLFLTRMGEGLFPYHTRRGFERFLHGVGKPVRNSMLGSVQNVVAWQLKLKKLGLVPPGKFERIARSTVSLVTDNFYELADQGKITVKRECEIRRLLSQDGAPHAELSSGEVVPADYVICATGWQQTLPFFSEELQQELTDEEGNYELYQFIQPLTVENLSFSGYNSSFFSPLSSEAAALWIAAFIAGRIQLPPLEERRARVKRRVQWMKGRSDGKHARATNLIPFSMHNIDETLNEIGHNVGALTRFNQWLMPINPSSYKKISEAIVRELDRAQTP